MTEEKPKKWSLKDINNKNNNDDDGCHLLKSYHETPLMVELLISTFHRWRNWGSERSVQDYLANQKENYGSTLSSTWAGQGLGWKAIQRKWSEQRHSRNTRMISLAGSGREGEGVSWQLRGRWGWKVLINLALWSWCETHTRINRGNLISYIIWHTSDSHTAIL